MNKENIRLAFVCGLAVILLCLRLIVVGELRYIFLLWNLFLAFIPYFIASSIGQKRTISYKILVSIVWLIFWPNASYLVTDFVHIQKGRWFWLDLSILTSFSLIGWMLAYKSWALMKDGFTGIIGKKGASYLFYGLIPLAAFGVYLGRVVRLNSWDIIIKPIFTFNSICALIWDSNSSDVWLFVFGFTVLTLVFYGLFEISNEKIRSDSEES